MKQENITHTQKENIVKIISLISFYFKNFFLEIHLLYNVLVPGVQQNTKV